MALSKKEQKVVEEIAKRYGNVIDLKKSPAVLIEILRNFGHILENGGTGGVSPSSIAGSGPPPPPPPPPPPSEGGEAVQIGDIMKAILRLQRDVNAISQVINKLAK